MDFFLNGIETTNIRRECNISFPGHAPSLAVWDSICHTTSDATTGAGTAGKHAVLSYWLMVHLKAASLFPYAENTSNDTGLRAKYLGMDPSW